MSKDEHIDRVIAVLRAHVGDNWFEGLTQRDIERFVKWSSACQYWDLSINGLATEEGKKHMGNLSTLGQAFRAYVVGTLGDAFWEDRS